MLPTTALLVFRNSFSYKAYTKYDRLGNLDEAIGKTVTHLVSADKTVKKYDSSAAQASVDVAGVYAYWIQSLPDENKQKVRFQQGATTDEPVKKGS